MRQSLWHGRYARPAHFLNRNGMIVAFAAAAVVIGGAFGYAHTHGRPALLPTSQSTPPAPHRG